MKIVVNISEDIYKRILPYKDEPIISNHANYLPELTHAVANGTPLPKGHGDLKDFQKVYADMTEIVELARQRVIDTPTNSPCYMRYVSQLNERTAFKEMLFDAPTIIKADEEQEE